MGKQSRRDFLKSAALIVSSSAAATKVEAAPENMLSDDRNGVLVDLTECIGCRKCEYACKTAHDIQTEDIETYEDKAVFENKRRPDANNLTVVNAYKSSGNAHSPVTVKVQCMHCDHPACLSACIVGAFSKDESGAVIWDEDKCIGCRYCMVACPFQIPAYEYSKAIEARVVKCDFCFDRQKQNKLPACVDICPVEALTFGPRCELIHLAREKIGSAPDRYIDHIYGEHEVGGTSWLYLAGHEFENFDFPDLGKEPAPGVSEAIQHGVFAYFVPPVAFYALLGGVMWMNKNKSNSEEE
jgi:Fe-S-cluster-containing dehydrogenase component